MVAATPTTPFPCETTTGKLYICEGVSRVYWTDDYIVMTQMKILQRDDVFLQIPFL